MAIFSTRNTTSGVWFNFSAIAIGGTSYPIRYNYTARAADGTAFQWKFYVNDTGGTMNESNTFTLLLVDTRAPYWLFNRTNFTTIKTGQNGQFNITFADVTALDTIIFSVKNSSVLLFENITTQRISGTNYDAAFNLTMTSRRNETFQWKFYVNDSSGNWNETDVFSTAIANTAPTLSSALINSTNPATNNTNQNLTAHPSGAADADNDNITYAYRWYNTTGVVAQSVHLED